MAASKLEYLKRYMSKDDAGDDTATKKKKKKKQPKDHGRLVLNKVLLGSINFKYPDRAAAAKKFP